MCQRPQVILICPHNIQPLPPNPPTPPQVNNIKYALGYDWDTVLPGAAALLTTLKVPAVSEEAAGWLEGYILAKWEDTTSLCPKESYANVCYTNKVRAHLSGRVGVLSACVFVGGVRLCVRARRGRRGREGRGARLGRAGERARAPRSPAVQSPPHARRRPAQSSTQTPLSPNAPNHPQGLAYYADWGTLRGTANMAFIAALMAKYGQSKEAHACWARSQLQYMLGTSDKNDVSYVIGYGSKQGATRPHHRGTACARHYENPSRPFNNGTCSSGEKVGGRPCCDADNFVADHDSPIMLKGALVGGPDQTDFYPNVRNDYKRSEVRGLRARACVFVCVWVRLCVCMYVRRAWGCVRPSRVLRAQAPLQQRRRGPGRTLAAAPARPGGAQQSSGGPTSPAAPVPMPAPPPSLAPSHPLPPSPTPPQVALDYQAGFTGAVAGLTAFQRSGLTAKCGSAAVQKAGKVVPDYSFCGGVGNM